MELRPSVINALVPELLSKVAVPGVLVSGVAWLIARFTPPDALFGIGAVNVWFTSWQFHALVWGLLALPFAWEMLLLSRTRYTFGSSAITREFRLLAVRRLTVPYDKVVHISSNISIWDRISGAGDIFLRTAEDKAPDLVLKFIPNPEKVEKWLIGKMK